MTREEAIGILKNTAWLGTDKDREETEQAVDMAIEALQVEPTKAVCDDCIWHVCNYNKVDWDALPSADRKGKWIHCDTDNSIECDKCGCTLWANDIMNGEAHFCPNCGVDMRGETE